MSNVIHAIVAGSNERPMSVDLHLPMRENPPVVILIHGFKGFKDWGHFPLVGDAFANAGFALLRFNFSHNGTTTDQPTDFADLAAFAENDLIKELNDLQSIIDGLNNRSLFGRTELDLKNIFLVGHSRGGGIALISAAEDTRIKGLATWASVNHYDRGGFPLDVWERDGRILIPNARTGQQMPMNWQFVQVLKANIDRLNIMEQSAKINVPTIVVHGTEDPTVPYQEAQDLVLVNSMFKLITVHQGDHSFGGKHPMEGVSLSEHMELVVDATLRHFNPLII